MELPNGLVKCGRCGKPCRRSWANEIHTHRGQYVPRILTRTLVNGVFLPSCSKVCMEELQAIAQGRRYS